MSAPLTDDELRVLREDCSGFPGSFAFQAAHIDDRGVGDIADFVDVDDRLVYIPASDDDVHAIADQIDSHVAEPMARMLNSVPRLLDEVERLRARVAELERAIDDIDRVSVCESNECGIRGVCCRPTACRSLVQLVADSSTLTITADDLAAAVEAQEADNG